MMETGIRRAGAGDAAALARLRQQFKHEDHERIVPEQGGFVVDCQRWLHDRLTSGRWLAWVADCDGMVRGHVFVNRVERIPSPLAESVELGYVTNFYVQPGYRGRGLGRALLDAVEDHARTNHFDTLIVWPSDRSTALYQRAGYASPAELLELSIATP